MNECDTCRVLIVKTLQDGPTLRILVICCPLVVHCNNIPETELPLYVFFFFFLIYYFFQKGYL